MAALGAVFAQVKSVDENDERVMDGQQILKLYLPI